MRKPGRLLRGERRVRRRGVWYTYVRVVRKLLVVLVAAAVAAAAFSPGRAEARECGLPDTTPMWVDFVDSPFWQVFARPGVVAAVADAILPAKLRAAGVPTVRLDLYLKKRVGTPTAPLDPATVVANANRLLDYTVTNTACATPTLVENELFGAKLATPWSESYQRYRDNVLLFLRTLAARGAHPVLLLNSNPFVASPAAAQWWRDVAAVADIVREDYVPANIAYRLGPARGNRAIRQAYRRGIDSLTGLGIPSRKLGIMISFSTHVGYGGRNGLEPGSGEGGPGSIIGQLRFPIDVPSQEQNLCVKCHHKRAQPETESATIRGPHSPEGPLLLGEGAGWFPPDFQPEVDKILGTHGSSANPKLCATCHVAGFTINDAETGDFLVRSVGHSFKAIPCVDGNGAPTNAADCPITERTFASCATAGCHGSEDVARSAMTTADVRIEELVQELDAMLLLPEVAPDNVQNDGRFTVADGAWFNSQLAKMTGSTVHNPFLIEQLLIATINQLRTTYNLPATVIGVSLERQIT